jgi:hypothetical protein
MWYRHIKSPKYDVNQMRVNYPLGESDTFAGAGYVDDHDTGIGVRYSPNHWTVKGLESIDFTAFIIEGQKYQFDADFNYEFQPGYGVEGSLIYQTDQNLKRLKGDWNAGFWHNLDPAGKARFYVVWVNNYDEELIVFGVKAQTN